MIPTKMVYEYITLHAILKLVGIGVQIEEGPEEGVVTITIKKTAYLEAPSAYQNCIQDWCSYYRDEIERFVRQQAPLTDIVYVRIEEKPIEIK